MTVLRITHSLNVKQHDPIPRREFLLKSRQRVPGHVYVNTLAMYFRTVLHTPVLILKHSAIPQK